jgi:hypothetical protein
MSWLTCKNPWITPPCRTGQPFPGLALALSRSGPSRWPFRRILHFGHILKGMPSPLTSNPALLAVFAGFGVHHRTDLPDWSPSPRKVAVMIPDSCAKCTSFGPGPTLSLGPGPVTMDRRPFGGTSGGPGPAHIIGPQVQANRFPEGPAMPEAVFMAGHGGGRKKSDSQTRIFPGEPGHLASRCKSIV